MHAQEEKKITMNTKSKYYNNNGRARSVRFRITLEFEGKIDKKSNLTSDMPHTDLLNNVYT